MTFTVVVTRDEAEAVFNATVPALPGCHTWGETEAEAYANASEAIKAYLEAAVHRDGIVTPGSAPTPGQRSIV
jgi:predicted RNase H-like HicB family nuclease